jgi:hypothetical protein
MAGGKPELAFCPHGAVTGSPERWSLFGFFAWLFLFALLYPLVLHLPAFVGVHDPGLNGHMSVDGSFHGGVLLRRFCCSQKAIEKEKGSK